MLSRFNLFSIVGGALMLLLIPISFYVPWWQLVVGDSLAVVNVSPINSNLSLMGNQFTIPLLWVLNLTGMLIFLFSGSFMIVSGALPKRFYAKEFLIFGYRKPLYYVLLYPITLIIITTLAQGLIDINVPLTGTSYISLPLNFASGIDISVKTTSTFLWPFYLAIATAIICIIARIYHPKTSNSAH